MNINWGCVGWSMVGAISGAVAGTFIGYLLLGMIFGGVAAILLGVPMAAVLQSFGSYAGWMGALLGAGFGFWAMQPRKVRA